MLIFLALDLHSFPIVHTDIKPNNIVLRRSDVVVVRRMRSDDYFVDKVNQPLYL